MEKLTYKKKLLMRPGIALRIAVIYALLGGLWILASDRVLAALVSDAALISRIQTFKGWFYVLMTAAILYGLVRHYVRALERREAALREVVRGVDVAVGKAFFSSLAWHLARAIHADFALICELTQGAPKKLHILAANARDKPLVNDEFPLAGTPCVEVMEGSFVFYPSGIRKRFPGDPFLAAQAVEGFAAAPLLDSSGIPVGLIVLMDRSPFRERELVESLLKVFAVRAATEMERLRAERQLRNQFDQISTIFDSLNAAVYVTDMDSCEILYLNSYLMERFAEAQIGRKCYQVFQTDQSGRCAFCTNDKLVIDGQPAAPYIWEFQNTSNKRWYQCIGKAIRWPDGRLVRLEIAVDITERKEMERIKDDMLSAVSHEMRTPLTAISGFTEYLLGTQVSPEELREHLQTMQIETERLNDLVGNFLDLQRLRAEWSSLELAPVSLPDVLKEALGAYQAAFPQRLFRFDGPEALPGVLANREQLRQVFDNLLSNAVKYSRPDSEVVLGVGQKDGEVVVSVSDRGVGIPPDEVERIFDRFNRLDTGDRRTTSGIGLGLSVVREIVRLHGGRVWVESSPGKGSCFYVALPVVENHASALRPSSQADP